MDDNLRIVAVEDSSSGVVLVVQNTSIVSVSQVEKETHVVAVVETASSVVEHKEVHVVSAGQQGPAGKDGESGTSGGVFVLDVIPNGAGIVGSKTYKANTVPVDANLATAVSDSTEVTVMVGTNGGTQSYSPVITVNGVMATLYESTTKRWFTGYADIQLSAGVNLVTITSSEGDTDTCHVTLAGAGPDVLSSSWGAYPGTQTEVKAGDVMTLTVITPNDAVMCYVFIGGASAATYSIPVVGNAAIVPVTISNFTGALPVTVKLANALGTLGQVHTSANLALNQTYPTIGAISVAYPGGQSGLKTGESATVTATVTNFDSISYASASLTIPSPSAYGASKVVGLAGGGYLNSGTNYAITATRAANNATSTRAGLVAYATVVPSAAISIVGSPARLVSSPTGIDYEVRVTPDQALLGAISLNASLGAFQGAWVSAGSYSRRSLRISDATARGTGVFSGLSMTGISGLVGGSITSGSTYIVGGFSLRTVFFPAFSRVAPLGAPITTPAKTTAQISGGNVLTLHGDAGVYSNGYYPANFDGTYNAVGVYLGLSDTAFIGSNTTGTLSVDVQETA